MIRVFSKDTLVNQLDGQRETWKIKLPRLILLNIEKTIPQSQLTQQCRSAQGLEAEVELKKLKKMHK